MSTPNESLPTLNAPSDPPSPDTPTTPALFAFNDFIRPGEAPLYAELDESLRSDLAPVGFLEHTLVDEIRRAMWRLRRCGLVEESFLADPLTAPGPAQDPMQIEAQARIQLTVDRARTQAHRLLHKCTAELRKLQTFRKYRDETFEAGVDISDHGLADWHFIRKGLDQKFRADYHREKFNGLAHIDAILSTPVRPYTVTGSFCKTAA